MNTQRIGTHLISTILLLLWGGILLYFYASGRIAHYLTSDGWFRPMALWGGIGMVVLGLYNLATIGAKEADCCEHDHGHDDHDHDHDHAHAHAHDHDHKDGCCGHDHSHDHGHAHAHEHGHSHKEGESCGHEHGHSHKESESCGHEHGHEPAHGHAHTHEHGHEGCSHEHHHHDHDHSHGGGHGHAHGILEESGSIGRLIAILLLTVPVTYAAIRTPDTYSEEWREKKDTKQYGKGGSSERFVRGDKREATVADTPPPAAKGSPAPDPVASVSSPPAATPPVAPTVASNPPGDTASPAPAPGSVTPQVNTKEVEKQATKSAQAKSYGSFTLADLKAQVPQSAEGNFILEVPELYYTAGDKEVQGVLTGQPVETIAQVLAEKVNNEKGTRLRVRLLVQCCAADARPYSIPVEFGKPAPTFKDSSWVKVTGKMNYIQEGGQTVPILEATSMVETAEPANSMVY